MTFMVKKKSICKVFVVSANYFLVSIVRVKVIRHNA